MEKFGPIGNLFGDLSRTGLDASPAETPKRSTCLVQETPTQRKR